MDSSRAVVVGVDGSDTAWAAMRWAAEEAHRTGRTLVVAHAGDVESIDGDAPGYGRQLLDDAVARLAEELPQLPVRTELRTCAADHMLRELSADADLVVIGDSGTERLARILLGSSPLRRHRPAKCPVVVVTRTDAPDDDSDWIADSAVGA